MYDCKGRLMATYNTSFSGWTSWILGNRIDVEMEKPKGSSSSIEATVYKYDYLLPEDELNSLPVVINPTDVRNVTTDWTASPAGEHRIVAIIDPKDAIPEINETNNVQMNFTLVQGPDLIVSDIKLLNITDGTELNAANISADELVNITANVSNIGVLPANSFNVSFFINELCVGSATIINLTQNEYTNVSTCWHAVVGNYQIVATADPGNEIAETNESNNKGELRAKVLGADLTVNISFNTTANRDNVTVTVNATVTNQGVLHANNFDSFLFFGQYKNEHGYEVIPCFYGVDDVYNSIRWVNRSYAGANCICVHVNATWHLENGEKVYWVKEGDIRIYDGKEEVAVPTEPCCIPVMSDTVSVSVLHGVGQGVELLFYPGDITIRNRSLGVDDTFNLSLVETAGKGIYTACIDADSEGVVPEHDKQDNQQVKQLKVLPDFWVSNISISGNDTELNGKNEGSTVYINTSITNSGLIAGVSDVDVFAVHDWVDLSPRFELSPQGYPYGYGYVITHPGVDALKIQFNSLNITTKNAPGIETRGFVYIRDKAGKLVEEWQENRQGPANSSWITGDTAYVYAPTKCGDSTESNVVIDKYQCMNRIANISGLELQAEETKNYTVMWTPANAGPHAIQMVIDPENKAAEMNESNNELNTSFYVVPYEDPAVVNITFDPLPPVPKNVPVNVTAHIFNNGNSTANFSVDLWALKEEIYDYETAHPTDDFNETIVTYPEANWTGVQFAEIGLDKGSITRRMKVEDLYKNTSAYFYSFNGENIEVWTKGNTTKIELLPFNSVSYNDRETTEADGGRKVWGCGIDKISHKIGLNHTAVSLGPGNSTNVTGILHQMRVGNGSSGYEIYAVVDMDNVLYEQNESNNELVKVLNAKIPDLTVSNITCDGPPKAEIENIGHEKADNVTVRFIRDVYTGDKEVRPFKVQNDGFYSISHTDAKVMRVHFEYLYVDEKKNGSLRIGNRTSWVDYKKDRPKGFWSSWVDVDSKRDSITHPVSLILNKGRYKVDRYEYGVDEPPGTAKPYEIGAKATRQVDVPFDVENEIYNLTVFADPENMVEESNEGNNDEKKMMGPDLTFVFPEITFLNINENNVSSTKLIAHENHTIRVKVKNTGCVAASKFYVKLYVNKSDNATSDEPVAGFPKSKQITRLEPGLTSEVDFSWTPEKGFYRVKVTVNEKNEIPDINDKNNVFSVSDEVKAGEPGYRAENKPLPIGGTGMLNGGIIYEPYCSYVCPVPDSTESYDYSHVFDPKLPQNAEVVLARLYMYVWGDKADLEHRGFRIGCLPEVTLTFNEKEKEIPNPTIYEDTTGASAQNYTYATYCYDVTSVCDGKNWHAEADFTRKESMRFGVNGMALIVVYKDSNSVLTSYWIGEGSDVLMAKNLKYPTGFEFDECTRKCIFEGIDAQKANASLLTVLAPYTSYDASKLLPEAGGKGDTLVFQGLGMQRVGNLIGDTTGHWEYRVPRTIAFTENEWEYVDVKDGKNSAEVQSRGNYLVLKHAILKVKYLPDLVPCIPRSVVVGLPITVDIENQGKSEARNFSVCFSVNGEPERTVPVEALEGGGRVQLTLPWTPRAVGQIVRLNVSVDCDNEVRELNEDNNDDSQLVAVRGMLPRLRGGGSSASAWKEGSGSGEGTGEGLGAGTTAGAAGKTVTGGKTGKTITGRLMKGTVARTEETGGGGSVRFSLFALLIRLAVVAVAVSLVCVGYWWERRWHKKNKH
ncbi:Serine protease [Candidatus Methanophagaceae archaeon]|nr:Serine protease [Methanophagales archaeon]